MGLKQVRFIDWFKEKFPEATNVIPDHQSANFDSVFIDINCILHPAMRAAKNEVMFVKKLFMILDRLLKQFVPGRICYFSVDGPAPLAKLLTQKARRAVAGRKKSGSMSTMQVTPGCPFMSRLEQYLSYYAVRYIQQRRSQGISPDLKFVIDHSNNPGEGESKIIENIVQQAANIRGRPCAILSMDSDAVLQAVCLGMPNIYVVRKDQPSNPTVVVSIDNFMRALEEIFPGEANMSRLDFCALCLFRGNDYLRGSYVGLEQLWKAYLYTRLIDPAIQAQTGGKRFLIDAESKTFDLFFLQQLILNSYKPAKDLKLPNNVEELEQKRVQISKAASSSASRTSPAPQKRREEGIKQGFEHASDMSSADELDDSEAMEVDGDEDDLDPVVEEEENEGEKREEEEEDIGADEMDEEEEEKEDRSTRTGKDRFSVQKYLEGILWNLEMYCSGKCPDVAFVYEYQYGPSRRSIVNYINELAQQKGYQNLAPIATSKKLGVSTSNKMYAHPLICALILLPVDSGSEYLPASIAPVHGALVEGTSKYITHEEMMVIGAKVSGMIDVLGSSGKPHDAVIAKELSLLYQNRAPYIWTRARVTPRYSHNSAPIPISPTVILDRLAKTSSTSTATVTDSAEGATAVGATPSKFVDLFQEQDIVRNVVKAPPVAEMALSPAVPWTAVQRQIELIQEAKRPIKAWPFFFARRNNAFRGNRGGSLTQHQHTLHQQQQFQPHQQHQAPQPHPLHQGHHHHRSHNQRQHQQQQVQHHHGHQQAQQHGPGLGKRGGANGNRGTSRATVETAVRPALPNDESTTAAAPARAQIPRTPRGAQRPRQQ